MTLLCLRRALCFPCLRPAAAARRAPVSAGAHRAPFSADAHRHHEHHHKAEEPRISFVEKVKVHGANALLGLFTQTGERFDRVLKGLNVVRVGSGSVTCELTVAPSVQNSYSTLHGGACLVVPLCA
jgi:hypothetical protein